MSRFRQIKHPANNPELESVYREAMAAGLGGPEEGVPSNLITSLSQRPDILKAVWGFLKATMIEGVLPPTIKQMISMTIAMQNDCRYCALAHTKALESMGVPEEVIQSCASDPDLGDVPPPQRAMLKFGLKFARNPKSVTDEDFETLRGYGLDDGEIIEVIMVAAYGNFLDAWADVSGIRPEAAEESG